MYLKVYAWELLGVARNAWNGELGCSITIGSSCIWDKFIFLVTGRPGDCMEMLLECLRNPGRRLGIVTELKPCDYGYSVCKLVLKSMAVVYCEHYEEKGTRVYGETSDVWCVGSTEQGIQSDLINEDLDRSGMVALNVV
eukprot:Gb_22560 [translate_table: standard]